jgi:hypothetical protein
MPNSGRSVKKKGINQEGGTIPVVRTSWEFFAYLQDGLLELIGHRFEHVFAASQRTVHAVFPTIQ